MRTDSAICSATSAGSAVNGPGRVFDRAVVVIPAHNEADHLPSSVKAVLTAAARLPLPVTGHRGARRLRRRQRGIGRTVRL